MDRSLPGLGEQQCFAWANDTPEGGAIGQVDEVSSAHLQWLFAFAIDDLDAAIATVRATEGLALEPVVMQSDDHVVALYQELAPGDPGPGNARASLVPHPTSERPHASSGARLRAGFGVPSRYDGGRTSEHRAMVVPPEYHGREQSFLKHRVLQKYLQRWGKKLGSISRTRRVRLWYVDCFAGPWKSRSASLEDTSIDIGLRALEEAATAWRAAGHDIEVKAVFVESRRNAFMALRTHLEQRGGLVLTHPFHGEFGEHVDTISRMLGDDPAFIFVDPTGFKGVAMSFIRPLVLCPVRDVMINVMFNDINRWKDDTRSFLRAQMRDFFGLEDDDLVPGLSESDLFGLYRQNLKERCGLRFAADLAVPHPTQERTWFHLVVGGNHREVLRVFREVEASVVGREAAQVRDEASKRLHEQRTGQTALLFDTSAPVEPRFETQYGLDAARVSADLVETLGSRPVRFADLWPALLEMHHVTRAKVARLALQAESQGQIEIVRSGGSTRRALPKDSDRLRRLDPGDPVAGSSSS